MRTCVKCIALAALLVFATTSPADEPSVQDVMATIKALKARIQEQNKRLAELESRVAQQQAAVGRVAKAMAEDGGKRPAGPKWLDNLTFYGDLRLRYQNDCYAGRSAKDRNRARFRLRFGIKKTWLDEQWEVGFRIASGSDDNPTSANQTFDDHFNDKKVWIDRAYAKYTPKWLAGLTVIGGKMANPLVHTDLIWDSDLSPEGVWGGYGHAFGDFEPFVNFGYWVLDEDYATPPRGTLRDVDLWTYQAGFNWKIAKDVKWGFAAAYYDFQHFEYSYRAANGNHEVGGVLMAGNFHCINLLTQIGFQAFGLPMSAYFDWVHNCGDDDSDPEYRGQDNGYAVGLKVGRNKKKGDWSVGYKYAYIQANSTPGALNDGDFGHSNRKGHKWSATYNVTDYLTLGGAVYWTEPVAGPNEDQRDVASKVDLIWKF